MAFFICTTLLNSEKSSTFAPEILYKHTIEVFLQNKMDKTFIDNNARQKKVNTDYHNLRHNLRAKKTFFKKIHPRGKLSKYYTSRVSY